MMIPTDPLIPAVIGRMADVWHKHAVLLHSLMASLNAMCNDACTVGVVASALVDLRIPATVVDAHPEAALLVFRCANRMNAVAIDVRKLPFVEDLLIVSNDDGAWTLFTQTTPHVKRVA